MSNILSYLLIFVLVFQTFFANFAIARNDRNDKNPIDPSKGTLIPGYCRLYETQEGLLLGATGGPGGQAAVGYSEDGGKTWSQNTPASFAAGRDCANFIFCEYEGDVYLTYRANSDQQDGFYYSIRVSRRTDGGRTWQEHSIVEERVEANHDDRGLWEPYIGVMNGKRAVMYCNDSRAITTMQYIFCEIWNGSEWTDQFVVCDGEKNNSRDGMPAWRQLSDGKYVMMIESSRYRDAGHSFVIRMLWSADGRRWNGPKDVYIPKKNKAKACSTDVIELPDGRLAVSFMTNEDVELGKGNDQNCIAKIIYTTEKLDVSEITRSSFTSAKKLYPSKYDDASVWGMMSYANGRIYYGANTKFGDVGLIIPVA